MNEYVIAHALTSWPTYVYIGKSLRSHQWWPFLFILIQILFGFISHSQTFLNSKTKGKDTYTSHTRARTQTHTYTHTQYTYICTNINIYMHTHLIIYTHTFRRIDVYKRIKFVYNY